MKDLDALRRRALALMGETLALLDEAGEDLAAAHQQTAHDVMARIVPPRSATEDRGETPELPELASDPALVRSIGAALAVFAMLMQRGGSIPLDEIAQTLGIYAVVSAETSPQEGLILGCWGAILREAAELGRDGSPF